jgi:hypothetical protein
VRELTAPVDRCDLCNPDGALNPAAVGWSRTPLVRPTLFGHAGRKKRWHHFAVLDARSMLAVTVADLDYLGVAAIWFLDLASGQTVDRFAATPFALGMGLPEDLGDLRVALPGVRVEVREHDDATELTATARGLAAEVRLARIPETMNVVLPWDAGRFQYTSKQTGRAVTGSVTVRGRARPLGGFATLDFGRGIWPWRTRWQWACAPGPIGLNLGGAWTEGIGCFENALFAGGRVTPIAERLSFTRDSIRSPSVDLRLTRLHTRRLSLELGLVAARLRMDVVRFTGRVLDRPIDLVGWSEDFSARW